MKGIDMEDIFYHITFARTLNFMEAAIIRNETEQSSDDVKPEVRLGLLNQFRKNGRVTKEDEVKLYKTGENKPAIPQSQYMDPNRGFKDIRPLN